MNPQKVPLLTFVCQVRMQNESFFCCHLLCFCTKFKVHTAMNKQTHDQFRKRKKKKEKKILSSKKPFTPWVFCNVPVKFLKLGFKGKSAVFLKICSKKNGEDTRDVHLEFH